MVHDQATQGTVRFLNRFVDDEEEVIGFFRSKTHEGILWIFIGVEWDNDTLGYYGVLEELRERSSLMKYNAYLYSTSGAWYQHMAARRVISAITRWSSNHSRGWGSVT